MGYYVVNCSFLFGGSGRVGPWDSHIFCGIFQALEISSGNLKKTEFLGFDYD